MPSIIRIENNLFALVFKLMKLIPARQIIMNAKLSNQMDESFTIVDTSSGTFALGLGLICCELGLKFKVFGDPAIDSNMLRILQDLGGDVHLVTKSKQVGAYQKERLAALKHYLEQNKRSFWTKQYDNPENKSSYHMVSEMIVNSLGGDINIVGPVGSGGSTGGIIEGIRTYNQSAQLIAVDTFNSILFGQEDGRRDLRGLGNSVLPKNLKHQLYDEVHWLCASIAFKYTRCLHAKKGIFCGPTSGAAYCVARYLATKNPDKKYMFICPDEGHRYLSTVYSDEWLRSNQHSINFNLVQPKVVSHPREAVPFWSSLSWLRRPLKEVI